MERLIYGINLSLFVFTTSLTQRIVGNQNRKVVKYKITINLYSYIFSELFISFIIFINFSVPMKFWFIPFSAKNFEKTFFYALNIHLNVFWPALMHYYNLFLIKLSLFFTWWRVLTYTFKWLPMVKIISEKYFIYIEFSLLSFFCFEIIFFVFCSMIAIYRRDQLINKFVKFTG